MHTKTKPSDIAPILVLIGALGGGCTVPYQSEAPNEPPKPEFLRDFLDGHGYRYVVRARDTAPCEPTSSTYYTENACGMTSHEGNQIPDQAMKQVWLDVIGEIRVEHPADPTNPLTSSEWGDPPAVRAVIFEHENSTVLESDTHGALAVVGLTGLLDDVADAPHPAPELFNDDCRAAREIDPYSCGPFSGGKRIQWNNWPGPFLRVKTDEVCLSGGGYSAENGALIEGVAKHERTGEEYCWPRRQLDCLTVWREGEGTTPTDCGPNEAPRPARTGDPNDGGLPGN